MAAGVDLRCLVLGPVATVAADGTERPAAGQSAAVLALLAADYPRPVRSARIAELLWGATPPASASTGVRVAVSRAREMLRCDTDDNPIRSDAEHYELTIAPDSIDVFSFMTLVNGARVDLARGRSETAVEQMQSALGLWRGSPFGAWGDAELLEVEVSQLQSARRDGEELLVDAMLASGRAEEAAAMAARWVETEPYRERRWMQLMLSLYRCDRQAEALRTFRRAADLLVEELGLTPSRDMIELERDILLQADHLDQRPRSPVIAADLSGLARSLRDAATVPPVPGTSFIGRGADTADVLDRLGTHRMVTLVGPGGVGKTRLATEVCALLDRSVIFVPLAAEQEQTIIAALASRLSISERSDIDLLETLVIQLNLSDAVIVFDNCEHVVDAVAELATALIHGCPNLTLLATSRHRVGITAEHCVTIAPLAPTDARELLVSRVRQMIDRDSFGDLDATEGSSSSIDELIRCVDRLPLAIELVASQLDTSTPTEILASLRSDLGSVGVPNRADPRHGDLASMVTWSYELLEPSARRLLAATGVFDGEFFADDAAAVSAQSTGDTSRDLRSLVRHSLIHARSEAGSVRYSVGEVVRLFARSSTPPSELAAFEFRHRAHYRLLVEQMELEMRSAREAVATGRLIDASSEVRRAWRRSVDAGDFATAVTILRDIHSFSAFQLQSELPDAAVALVARPECRDVPNYPSLLACVADTQWSRNDGEGAYRSATEAIASAERLGQPVPIKAHQILLVVCAFRRQLRRALEHHEHVREIAVASGQPQIIAHMHTVAAIGGAMFGLDEAAADNAQEAVRLADLLGNPTVSAWASYGAAMTLVEKQPHQALPLFEEGIAAAGQVHNLFISGMNLSGLARSLRWLGRQPEAAPIVGQLLDVWSRANRPAHLCDMLVDAALLVAPRDRGLGARAIVASEAIRIGESVYFTDTAAVDGLRLFVAEGYTRVWTDQRIADLVAELVESLAAV